MKVEVQITIKGNKLEVWEAITNIKHAAEIIRGVEKIEILNEPINGLVGLKWRESRMYFGKLSAIDKWITSANENEFYTTRAEMDGFIFITTMAIKEDGDKIILRSSHETKSQNIIAKIKSLPMFFFKGMLRKAILKDLMDIKDSVEKE
jgi:hypothetical protein